MNRKRLLWPLLFAAAFALGVLAAQVHAGDIFLPLVAKASPGQETPTLPPPGTVTVENVHCHTSENEWYGELINHTGCTVNATGVTMYLLDADGLPVANTTGRSMAPLLAPGQRTPFRVYWYDPLPSWTSYVIYPQWDPVDRLTIDSATTYQPRPSRCYMSVTLHNQLPVRVEALSVGMVVYDLAGKVIGYGDRSHLHGPLDPGDTLTVEHTFYWWDSETPPEPVACAAFAVPGPRYPYLLTDQQP